MPSGRCRSTPSGNRARVRHPLRGAAVVPRRRSLAFSCEPFPDPRTSPSCRPGISDRVGRTSSRESGAIGSRIYPGGPASRSTFGASGGERPAMSTEGESVGPDTVAETVDGFAVADPGASTSAVARPGPVEAGERVTSVDVLRGVAVLGILAMNAVSFAWPDDVYSNPIRDPDAGGLDVALWAINRAAFDTKMMTLFSMLFGAGLVLMSDRAEGKGVGIARVYYRRLGWLLAIGLVHAYLIWGGDILVEYAACGFLLYPFRKLRPRTLIAVGLGLNLLFVPFFLGFRA